MQGVQLMQGYSQCTQLTLFPKVEDGRGELVIRVQSSGVPISVLYLDCIVFIPTDRREDGVVCFPCSGCFGVQYRRE